MPTALSAAAAGGHVDIAGLCIPQELSSYGVAVDMFPRSKSKGWGPLHWAASNGHLAMSQYLMNKGFSVRDEAFDGSIAVDLARRHGHDEIVQLLESIQPKPLNAQTNLEDQEQTQHDLQLIGTLLSTSILCIKANFFIVIAAESLLKRDIFCKRSAKLSPSSC